MIFDDYVEYFKNKFIYTGDVFIKVKKEKKSFWKVFDRLW